MYAVLDYPFIFGFIIAIGVITNAIDVFKSL